MTRDRERKTQWTARSRELHIRMRTSWKGFTVLGEWYILYISLPHRHETRAISRFHITSTND